MVLLVACSARACHRNSAIQSRLSQLCVQCAMWPPMIGLPKVKRRPQLWMLFAALGRFWNYTDYKLTAAFKRIQARTVPGHVAMSGPQSSACTRASMNEVAGLLRVGWKHNCFTAHAFSSAVS